MPAALCLRAAALLLAALSFLFPLLAAAQKPVATGKFAGEIKKEIRRRNLSVAVLVDLANPEGFVTERTQNVTAELSKFLVEPSGSPEFLWVKFTGITSSEKIPVADPQAVQKINALCLLKKCDSLLLGSVREDPAGKRVSLRIVNPQTKAVLGELSALLPASTGEPLVWSDPNFSDPPPYAAVGKDGVSFPVCYYQPDPSYTEEARRRHIQGNVTLDSVISKEGKMVKVAVKRGLEPGLDREALETVRRWKCKPARDRNGNAVSVQVPVEISFRLLN